MIFLIKSKTKNFNAWHHQKKIFGPSSASRSRLQKKKKWHFNTQMWLYGNLWYKIQWTPEEFVIFLSILITFHKHLIQSARPSHEIPSKSLFFLSIPSIKFHKVFFFFVFMDMKPVVVLRFHTHKRKLVSMHKHVYLPHSQCSCRVTKCFTFHSLLRCLRF